MHSPPHDQTSCGKGHRIGASGTCLLSSVAGDLASEKGLPETHLWERRVGIGLLGEMSRGDGVMSGIKIRVPYSVGWTLEPSEYLLKKQYLKID